MSDHITVIGNIATEPERRQTSTGVCVMSFRLASTQRHRDDRTGQWVDGSTNWYTVSAFRQLAEHALESLQKGQRVIVTGKLRLRSWETSAKKGLDVEIDADGLGHDLRWGTSTFQHDTSNLVGEPAAPTPAPPEPFPQSYPADRLAGADERTGELADERTGELVGAGLVRNDAWDTRPLGSDQRGDDRPF